MELASCITLLIIRIIAIPIIITTILVPIIISIISVIIPGIIRTVINTSIHHSGGSRLEANFLIIQIFYHCNYHQRVLIITILNIIKVITDIIIHMMTTRKEKVPNRWIRVMTSEKDTYSRRWTRVMQKYVCFDFHLPTS